MRSAPMLNRGKRGRCRARALGLWCVLLAGMLTTSARADQNQDPAAQVPPGPPTGVLEPAPPRTGIARWFDPDSAPFLPIPLIGLDPDSGTTLGLLPVKLQTDDNHDIRRIIAPDIYHNQYFGFGAHARVYDYPSEDEQWSMVGGISERVERTFDAEYQNGRLRDGRWSINASVVFDRSGVPRFYGIGNETPKSAETVYTAQEELLQLQVGLNLSHVWQLLYTGRFEVVDVLPGTLKGFVPLQNRYADITGLGTNDLFLNRLSIGYDTRDNVTAPSHGIEWVAYGGVASHSGLINDSVYSEAGIDGRNFWPLAPDTILATHVALRYLPSEHRMPFWALSGIGGEQSQIGGEQPLRGFGVGRYYDRDSFSATAELRHNLMTINAVSSHVDLELAPFVDLGRVFSDVSTLPVSHLHVAGGMGVRGIARPFVVGYVDFGYGSEGLAVFTGINYPF
jgi:surface antigen Omp85-like protein